MALREHQKGVCGHLRIRGEASALRGLGISCGFGAAEAVMKDVKKKASFFVAVAKDAFQGGGSPRLRLRASGEGSPGDCEAFEVRALLFQEASVLEVRMELSGLRFWVEYVPYGLEPVPGDVVRLEPFASIDDGLSSVLPRRDVELRVEACAEGSVMVAWDHAPDSAAPGSRPWRCVAKLRRSAVFVSRRDTWTDTLIHQPVNALLDTELGHKVQPVAHHASVVLSPLIAATKLAWQSIFAVGGAVFSQETRSLPHG